MATLLIEQQVIEFIKDLDLPSPHYRANYIPNLVCLCWYRGMRFFDVTILSSGAIHWGMGCPRGHWETGHVETLTDLSSATRLEMLNFVKSLAHSG